MRDREIFQELSELVTGGSPCALATVIATSGSAPRKAGAKMLVRADGTINGTVGGGRVEAETIEAAVAALASGHPEVKSFVLTEEHNFVCGGSVDIYIEPYCCLPRVLVFGGGHVGKAVARLADDCGFHVTVIDERPEVATRENLPGADEVICCPVGDAVGRVTLTEDAAVVIATPGHVRDFEVVRAVLATATGFIGLVGSRRKLSVLLEELERDGVPAEERARVVCPVGLPIGAETPAQIAVSIVGQLIERRGNRGR